MALTIQSGDIVAVCAGTKRGAILADLIRNIPSFLMARIFVVHQHTLDDPVYLTKALPGCEYTISEIMRLTIQHQAITFILSDCQFSPFTKAVAEVFVIEDEHWKCASHLSRQLQCEITRHTLYQDVNVLDNREPVQCVATV
jgi:hypothetical protein